MLLYSIQFGFHHDMSWYGMGYLYFFYFSSKFLVLNDLSSALQMLISACHMRNPLDCSVG